MMTIVHHSTDDFLGIVSIAKVGETEDIFRDVRMGLHLIALTEESTQHIFVALRMFNGLRLFREHLHHVPGFSNLVRYLFKYTLHLILRFNVILDHLI